MYKLITDGTDIMYNSNNLSWSSSEDTLGIQLTFDTVKDLYEGQVVSLFSDDKEVIRGIIIKKTQGRWTYSYTVRDYSFYLKNKIPVKQFNKSRADDCIKTLLSEAYIDGNICSIPTSITEIYRGRSRSEIIDDILDKASKEQGVEYFKEIQCTTLYIRSTEEMKIEPKIILPKDINIESSIENMKNKIYVISTSSDDNKIYATSEDSTYQYWYGVLEDVQEIDAQNVANAKNIADNILNSSNKIEKSTSFEAMCLDDCTEIRAHRLIYLKAGARLNGYYKIKNVTHTITKGIHKVNLEISWKVNA